jgi:hypothetical protein
MDGRDVDFFLFLVVSKSTIRYDGLLYVIRCIQL